MLNSSASFDGHDGDVLMTTGSTDQTGNYVFEVMPNSVGPEVGLQMAYWNTCCGNDTMYSLWSPGGETQRVVLTLYSSDGIDTYAIPVTLAPGASTMIDVGMLRRGGMPDASGNLLPPGVEDGSAMLEPAGAGSYDFLMREYSPTQSRWWTPDPAGLAAADPNDPQSWNQFAYVAGTPLTAVDPLGLDPCENWTDRQGNLHSTRTPFIGGGGGGPIAKGCTVRLNRPGHHAHLLATNFDVNGDRRPHAGASTGPAQLQPGGAQAGRAAQPRWGPRPSMDANLQDCQPGGSNPSAPAVPISPQLVLPAGPVCVSAAQINSYLAQTPLAGQGQAFYDAGQAYGVNPALAVAIAGAESTFGENVDTTWGLRNTWGWGSTPAPHRIAQGWTTWQQGIYRVTWQLGRPLYLGGGVRTTSAAIYGAWCQSGDCTGGLAKINGVLDHFGVNPASLRFKACAEERQ